MLDKFRARAFMIILYPDDERCVSCVKYIKDNYDYLIILHDQDISDDGSLKKAHYHVIIKFPNARWNTKVSDELNIPLNYIQKINNFDNSLLYLIHYNDENKFHYDPSLVQGTLLPYFNRLLNNNNMSEDEIIIFLINYINDQTEYIRLQDFIKYCCSMGYYSYLRRSSYLFLKIIEEKNKNI